MKKYEFNYKIKEIDLQTGNVLVEYSPVNINLTNYIFNIPVYLYNEDGTKKTLLECIGNEAPHYMWEAQELLLDHGSEILNSTGTIDPNAI